MKSTIIFLIATFYLLAVSHASPVKKKKEAFDEKDVIYTGQHDIDKIYTSLALLDELNQRIVFFTEADINNDGSKVDQGLYVIIENSTTKLLDSGKDISGDGTGKVYLATKDGLYTYNLKDRNVHKFGNIAESIISVAAENNTGVVYALTENRVLFKITENGKKSDVDDRVKHAQEIILDMFDNLYYYDKDKNLYVVVGQNAKRIESFPKNPTNIKLIRPPPGSEGILLLADDVSYVVYSNGTSIQSEDMRSKRVKPTAYSFDALLVLYFGQEKNIYELNILEKILEGVFEGIGAWIKKNITGL